MLSTSWWCTYVAGQRISGKGIVKGGGGDVAHPVGVAAHAVREEEATAGDVEKLAAPEAVKWDSLRKARTLWPTLRPQVTW